MITDDFIQVVNANDQAAFVGTLSRDAERGTAFTAERGGERNFTSLDELAAAGDVDAVYIGSPNALHYEQALACIAGGKHVIVESPSAPPKRRRSRSFALPRQQVSWPSRLCVPSTIPPSTPSRTSWARLPHPPRLIALWQVFLALQRDSRGTCHQYLRLQYGIGFPHGHWRLHRRAHGRDLRHALRSHQHDHAARPLNAELTMAPSTAAAPFSPVMAEGVSPSSSRTPKLRMTCCPRRSKASVALSRSTICPRPATSASTIAATSYAARRPRHRANRRQRPRARPAQIEQHYGIRTHRLYHRHRRHR
ncbi:MAG: Gfo/Idh/MocA family protein [Collinsella sp.]